MRRFGTCSLLLLLAAPAAATEGGSGHYLLGSRDILAGIVPPPGVYVSADVASLDSRTGQLSMGGVVLADAKVDVLLAKFNLTKSFGSSVLGGRPMVTLTQPVARGRLGFEASTPLGPVAGSDRRSGLGDTVVTLGLGWDDGPNHFALQPSFFLPLGTYEPARVDIANRTLRVLSIGKNRFGMTTVLAFTRLPPTGLELSGALGLSLSARNSATDYKTAPELHFEGAIAQHFSPQFRAGLAGYAYQQLGEDKGAGADRLRAVLGTGSLKARVYGIGPLVGYSGPFGGHSLTLKAKYAHEFGAKRRLEGNAFQFTAALAF